MTRGNLVSKVVCADILLFKCQSVNYANGPEDPSINTYMSPFVCARSYISCKFLKIASPCYKEKKIGNMK